LLAWFIRHGDEDAFAQIVQRHGAMVYRICARLCGTRQDAEDAAQYVFVTLARKALTLHARTCLAGWLHRTASHTAQRWRRSATTRRRHEQLAGALRPDFAEGGDGLDELDELESLDQLQRALGALPEDYRNALILHHLEGHTIEEIAQLLAAPPGTIASRLSRGRAMLRDRLATLGVVLLATDLDDLLLEAVAGPETVPALADASFPTPVMSYAAKGTVASAFGCTVAAPLVSAMKLKVGTLMLTLCFSTLAGAGTIAAINSLFPASPTGTPPPVLHDIGENPVVYQRSSPSDSSVPEPSGLIPIAAGALLVLRRRSRH
jgi:RNA polymerase sigma factor (sigma-70 family)